MADWMLIACLKQLFTEFNVIAPDRGHASDGSIGDLAHQREVSDHNPDETGSVPIRDVDRINEVHAIDVDVDLREPGLSMEMVVQFILGRCRSGAEKRLRYIIFNRRVWDYRSNWTQRPYAGPSAHTEHAHFSASYETRHEADTSPWRLEEIPVALTAGDKTWIAAQITNAVASLIAETPLYGPDGKTPDGTFTTPVGHAVLSQGAPAEPDGARVAEYKVIAEINKGVQAIARKVGA